MYVTEHAQDQQQNSYLIALREKLASITLRHAEKLEEIMADIRKRRIAELRQELASTSKQKINA